LIITELFTEQWITNCINTAQQSRPHERLQIAKGSNDLIGFIVGMQMNQRSHDLAVRNLAAIAIKSNRHSFVMVKVFTRVRANIVNEISKSFFSPTKILSLLPQLLLVF
jgi:hypothetical protein